MISLAQPLPVGNAVRVLLAPVGGTVKTRVLRKLSDDISDEADPAAAVVYEGDERSFVDITTLINGTPYYYRAFDFDGTSWAGSESAHATPAASAILRGPNPLELVRERLEAGLKVEVAAQRLRHEQGYIPCLTAPPLYDNVKWPVVSVHLRSEVDSGRGLGEIISVDIFDPFSNEWTEGEGWISRVMLDICGWSLNADERKALRTAIKKIIIANLPVFADAGMSEIGLSQSDVEDFETYNAPVYQTLCGLNCLAPSVVESAVDPIDDVSVDAIASWAA